MLLLEETVLLLVELEAVWRSLLLTGDLELVLDFVRLFLLQPPPTGTFLRAPPLVQYLLQVLQKCLGCVRL